MTLKEKQKQLQLQYLSFRITQGASDLFVYAFYSILLYRQTGSLITVFNDKLIYHVALFIGYVLGSFVIDRIGYLKAYKYSMISMGIALTLVVLNISNLQAVYVLLAIVWGIPRGAIWSIHNSFALKEIHKSKRAELINIRNGIIVALGVVIPALAGFIITEFGGYKAVFSIGALLYFLTALIPWSYNKVPRSKLTSKEIIQITKRRHFPFLIFELFFSDFVYTFHWIFAFIVPFLILGDELSVGLFFSIVGIIEVFVLITKRKVNLNKKIQSGFLFFIPSSFINLFFVIVWTPLSLAIRNIFVHFSEAIGFSIWEDLDYRCRELLLGKSARESTLELNLLIETAFLFSRTLSIGLIVILFSTLDSDPIMIIRIVWGVIGFGYIFSYWMNVVLRKRLNHLNT